MSQALRTQPDIDNIRAAYDRSASWSASTAPNVAQGASERPVNIKYASVPGLSRKAVVHQVIEPTPPTISTELPQRASPVASNRSTTSTLDSTDAANMPEVETALESNLIPTQAVPLTPTEFSALFPSNREILIHHDDNTEDGNSNLRLDTLVVRDGSLTYTTLFHLKMHSLKDRVFSLRRYCRDSGREVCNSTRKKLTEKPAVRPGIHRSLSHAVSTIRARSMSRRSLDGQLRRRDSGYSSVNDGGSEEVLPDGTTAELSQKIIRLEFSNYAQVDVHRRGAAFSRRYEFGYWGVQYAWRRSTTHYNGSHKAAFHLICKDTLERLAYITPAKLSTQEDHEERYRGGWVMPYLLKIEDSNVLHSQKDLSDVIVAAGLIAIVDNALKDHASSTILQRSSAPRISFIKPKRFLDELLNRHRLRSS